MLRADYTTEQVYKMIGPNARTAVDAARRYRANVAGVRALAELQPVMKAADAVKLGITVLRERPDGSMAVGIFDLPALHIQRNMMPKSTFLTCRP